MAAANMPTKTSMPGKSAVPATGGMASAMLRYERNRRQEEYERRDEKRTMHETIICPMRLP